MTGRWEGQTHSTSGERRVIMLISVRVIPRSKKNSVEWDGGDKGERERLRVRLTAAPVDGAANEALVGAAGGAVGGAEAAGDYCARGDEQAKGGGGSWFES